MEFTIKIDITERLEKSLQALTAAMFNARVFPTPKDPGPVITPSEPESAPDAKIDPPADVKPEAVETAAQNDNAEPGIDKAFKSLVVAVASEQPEKKPKKRTSKKAENLAVETPKDPGPVITPSEPESAPDAKIDPPADVKPEPSDPKASDDDPMCGMTVLEAMQAVMNEIDEKGLEMADVNARVRARAAEAGIAYSSIICLIKAIGYKEARRVALGEK